MYQVNGYSAYTGIGSRKAPPDILAQITEYAGLLYKMGYTLRSGGANGCDDAFERGSQRSEIYLPWPGFNRKESRYTTSLPEAYDLARRYHPVYDHLSRGARSLMARNVHQVLGPDLISLSIFVLCWTPDGCESLKTRTSKTGGTGLAIAVASERAIPVINLKNKDALERLSEFLDFSLGI